MGQRKTKTATPSEAIDQKSAAPESEIQKLAAQKLALTDQWLDTYEKLSRIAPYMRQVREVAQWEHAVISQAPLVLQSELERELKPQYMNSLAALNAAAFPFPSVDPNSVIRGLVVASGSGTATYAYLANLTTSADVTILSWAKSYGSVFEDVQRSSQQVSRITDLLRSLRPEIADEFEEAEKTYQAAAGGWQERTGAGIAMRNVLEHYKGALCELSRMKPKEQKITWSTMVSRLTIEREASPSYARLEQEEHEWKQLHDSLSRLAKNLTTDQSLEVVHTRWLAHLLTVLSLVKLNHS